MVWRKARRSTFSYSYPFLDDASALELEDINRAVQLGSPLCNEVKEVIAR